MKLLALAMLAAAASPAAAGECSDLSTDIADYITSACVQVDDDTSTHNIFFRVDGTYNGGGPDSVDSACSCFDGLDFLRISDFKVVHSDESDWNRWTCYMKSEATNRPDFYKVLDEVRSEEDGECSIPKDFTEYQPDFSTTCFTLPIDDDSLTNFACSVETDQGYNVAYLVDDGTPDGVTKSLCNCAGDPLTLGFLKDFYPVMPSNLNYEHVTCFSRSGPSKFSNILRSLQTQQSIFDLCQEESRRHRRG